MVPEVNCVESVVPPATRRETSRTTPATGEPATGEPATGEPATGEALGRSPVGSRWGLQLRLRVALLAAAAATGLVAATATAGDGAGEPPANNLCEDAQRIDLGSFEFSTLTATTDGPPLPQVCDVGFGLFFEQDVWFLYTAGFDGLLEVSTCGTADFDTRLAAYIHLGPCDLIVLVACNDDGPGCPNFTSLMQFQVEDGRRYLIRVGGFLDSGTGVLTLTDRTTELCIPSDHDCFTVGAPGCDDIACCAEVCAIDPFCCETFWDQICVTIATVVCSSCGASGSGDCCVANGTPSCDDLVCCLAVCDVDPFCCQVEWDLLCVAEAGKIPACNCDLTPPASCNPDEQSCFRVGDAGCSDVDCCATVCTVDPFCCASEWDELCVDAAFEVCSLVCGDVLQCVGDLNGDGVVDGADLGILLEAWGDPNTVADLNCDGVVDGADLGILLEAWGTCAR